MRKLLSLVVLGALLVAACGGGSGSGEVAATVDGTDITVSQVEALIESEGAVSVQDFAQFLAAQIQWVIFFDAAEADYSVTVTDEEVEAEATSLYEELASGDESREEFLSQRGVTEEFLTNIARQSALDVKLREVLGEDVAAPTTEEIEEARKEAIAPLTNACVSHILVATADEATQAMTRLEEGEQFGALATELSTDTGSAANNGELPCGTLENYVPPFRNAALDATVGEVYPDPVQSQFGFHIILVTERTDAAEADLPAQEELEQSVRDDHVLTDLQTWFTGVMEAAEVTVAEEYGTWTPNPPTVTPPAN